MHLKCAIELIPFDNKIIAVPVDETDSSFHGVIKLNETAAFIVGLLQKEITEEQIVEKVVEKYNSSRDLIAKDVHRCIELFRDRNMLDM